MAHTIYCGKIAKRKNSTLQPTLTTSFDVLLKSPTSLHTPTFSISAETFDYNYIQWGDRYYFVTDVVSRNNNLWDVSCVCDVLATYKTDILASTQFVSYSSYKSSIWLPDTRLPIQKNASVASNTGTIGLFDTDGFYVLSVIGDNSSAVWCCTEYDIFNITKKLNDWSDTVLNSVMNGTNPIHGTDSPFPQQTYTYSTVEDAIRALGIMNMLTGIAGNAYNAAPGCIRSCIWVPFLQAPYGGLAGEIMLGQFGTGVTTERCKTTPHSDVSSISIPWQYSDWRRAICEEVYLYLPLVGMVSIPSDEIINESTINIKYSATATDGCIAYEVLAGNQVIGTFGANCSVNYSIGISQQASAGEIAQTAIGAFEKVVSTGVQAASSLNPAGWAVGGAGVAAEVVTGLYSTIDTALTRHNSYIGGIGGGAGIGLDLTPKCFTVAHPTTIEPDAMLTTMGVPTMQPMTLSSLTGFCQCANAHVSASGAELSELAEIDGYLNSGFYIE